MSYGETPLIIAGSMLHISDVQMLPVEGGQSAHYHEKTKIKLYAAVGGYSVLDKILVTDPKDYQRLLWKPCKEIVAWIGSANFDDELDSLFRVFDVTRFGDASVDLSEDTHTIVTLHEFVDLLRNGIIASSATAQEISTRKVSVPKDTPIIEAIKIMFQKRIRRLFVDDIDRENEFISSRKIIAYLFSPDRLLFVKEHPERWLEGEIKDVELVRAEVVSDTVSLNKLSRLLGNDVEACLLTEKSGEVITRWDLIMKTWKKTGFRINEENIGKNSLSSQLKTLDS
ncbi:MAG: hypothetical protein OK439_07535 [Thaumarchaeota archaeon]|nr:hypothetical protein [Nitrososphaerota archaeon]